MTNFNFSGMSCAEIELLLKQGNEVLEQRAKEKREEEAFENFINAYNNLTSLGVRVWYEDEKNNDFICLDNAKSFSYGY